MNWRCIQFLVAFGLLYFPLQAKEIGLQFKEATWFANEVATAYLFVDSTVEPTVVLPEDNEDIRFYSNRFEKLEKDDRGTYVLKIDFVPRRAGLRTFPAVMLTAESSTWMSQPRQFVVSEPIRSSSMGLTITPSKKNVYVGEPVRLDFAWRCDLPIAQLYGLRLSPNFFSDPSIKVFIPRSKVKSDLQFGLPVGGRRIISHRIYDESKAPGTLGELQFSIWVRFETAGSFEISDTRLACSLLEKKGYGAHQYASYFNNSLFEAVDRSKAYQKLFTIAKGFGIVVKPLPEAGRLESFSGLFTPVSFDISVTPENLNLGQLMEIHVDVNSEVCSEMLELPSFSMQSSLLHRFWVAAEQSELWRADGRSFVARARPLTAELRFFPSLSFQVFNVDAGAFETVETRSIPLQIVRNAEQSAFSIENLPGTRRLVEANPLGVWHNVKRSSMEDIVHAVIGFLAEGAWVFLIIGPLAYLVLTPWVRELRRRSIDKDYGMRRRAYLSFCKNINPQENDPEPLRLLVAACFNRDSATLTASDAGKALRGIECEAELAREVETLLRESDEGLYSGRDARKSKLSESKLRKLGKQVYQSVSKVTVLALTSMLACSFTPDVEANSWDDAELEFAAAQALAESGAYSSEIEEAFAAAALSFEACAKADLSVGSAWHNAGNAWFKAGELGRSIAAYRRAQAYEPFNKRLNENLAAARNLRVDTFSDAKTGRPWPSRWLLAVFSLIWLSAWLFLLLWKRYRTKPLLALAIFGLLVGIAIGGNELRIRLMDKQEGVLIADEAYARKGPGFAYQSAFLEPLHNGTEFSIEERRDDWLRVSLPNGEQCWLPLASVAEL